MHTILGRGAGLAPFCCLPVPRGLRTCCRDALISPQTGLSTILYRGSQALSHLARGHARAHGLGLRTFFARSERTGLDTSGTAALKTERFGVVPKKTVIVLKCGQQQRGEG